MSNYNPAPRGILIQPLDQDKNSPTGPAVYYYLCVFDVPDSWGTTLTFDGGVANETDKSITYTITNAGFVFPSGTLPADTPFTTNLFPVFTAQTFNDLRVVNIKDTSGNIKTGTINNSTPVKATPPEHSIDDVDISFSANQCRPFIVKNGSRADQFFIGAMALTPGAGYSNLFKSITKDATTATLLNCEFDTGSATTAVNAVGAKKASLNEFLTVQMKNNTNPALVGTYNYASPGIISI